MDNIELQLLQEQGWRFTKVYPNDKKPYPNGWQINHLALAAVPQTDNIGVVLGRASSGVMALDFDGLTAWDWFARNINCTLPPTVTWASGKDARCQMAFTIPADYWEFIRTIKITTKPGNTEAKLKSEQMEFRWDGAQSVLPPSVHPERKDGFEYSWVVSPSVATVAVMPDAILQWLLQQAMPKAKVLKQQGNIETIEKGQFEQLEAVLAQLKSYRPTLDYDAWLRITFAVASEIGDAAAPVLMAKYWPEEQDNEYARHLRGRDRGRSPTMGSLVHMVKEHQGLNVRQTIKNRNKF